MSGSPINRSSIQDLIETGLDDDFRSISNVRPETPAFNNSLLEGVRRYQDILRSGANYFQIDDVDEVDDYYDRNRLTSLGESQFSTNQYFSEIQAPEYLKNFNTPATSSTVSDAFGRIANLTDTQDIASTLSEYYGYDITPAEQNLGSRFGGNLQSHTGTSIARLTEFHSLVEPILQEQVPFLQATEGLNYQDALIEAYKRDPMLQSLYYKYDVTPIRQTDDGSTYLYDPFTYGEIRTLEVKDPSIGDIAKSVLPTLALSAILGPIAGTVAGTVTTAGTAANAALTSALASAASAGIQGSDLEDALKAGLISGGLTYAGDAISGLREGGQAGAIDPSAPELTFDPRDPTVPTSVSRDVVDTVTGTLTGGEVADALSPVYELYDQVIQEVGLDTFNSPDFNVGAYLAARGRPDLLNLGLASATQEAFLSGNPLRTVENLERYGTTGDLLSQSQATPPGGMELTTQQFPARTTTVKADLETLVKPERITERPIRPTQMPGGGGGASGGAASAPATSVVSPSAPSATVTPVVPQPTFAAPGSITSSLFSSFAPALAAAAVAPQPTVAPPITPVATTAPTSEPTPPTTTQPTDILEDTTAEDTTAQMEAEAEAARLAEEARKAEEARAAAEAKAAAEQEAIAQAEARADAAEAARAAAEAQAKADAAAAEARYGEAVAAGEALGEAQYGEGLGTGRGQGAGAGIGAGLGLGLLAGMGGGAGGTGGYTPPDFEDYQFRKTYQAPELLELAPQYESYQAPTLQGLFRGFI